MKRNLRRSYGMIAFMLVALGITLWPQQTSALRAVVMLADNNQAFSTGRFFRTGLVLSTTTSATTGGVRLIPVKVQDTWPGTNSLPQYLSSHTSATYEDHIFVVGGYTYENQLDKTKIIKSGNFYATRMLDPRTGALEDWNLQPALPALPVAVSDPSSLVVTINNTPYLIVLGGWLSSSSQLDDVTTSQIFYYPLRFDANKRLVVASWGSMPVAQQLPYEPYFGAAVGSDRGGGARGISVVTANVNGTPYLYLFGGNNRVWSTSSNYQDSYSSQIWRTQIRLQGNTLALGPANCQNMAECWTNVGDITDQQTNTAVRLAGAATVAAVNPATGSTGVYLTGGTLCTLKCDGEAGTADTQSETRVFAAQISTDGTFSWLRQGGMSLSRDSHDAVQHKGQIVIAAGRTAAGQPTTTLARGYIEPDTMDLYEPEPNAPNFNLEQGAMQAQPRMNHTMEVLDAGEHGAWAYIIGGQVQIASNNTARASNDVLMGNLYTPPKDSSDYVSDGKYYTKIFDFGSDATYFNLNWKTQMAADQTIQMFYRVGPSALALSNQPWLGGFASTNGQNGVALPDGTKGPYIQFMAVLKRSATGLAVSPILASISVDVDRKGFPNVRVADTGGFSITPNPLTRGIPIKPSLTLANTAFNADNPALPADYAAPGVGTFFVDLYAFPIPEGGPNPPAPVFGVTESAAYAQIKKPYLGIDALYGVESANWRPNSCIDETKPFTADCPVPSVDWRSVFSRQGKYAVYVMVDSLDPASYNAGTDFERQFGNLQESDASNTLGETDNLFGPYTVDVPIQRPTVYVPLTTNQTPKTATTQELPVRKPRVHSDAASR